MKYRSLDECLMRPATSSLQLVVSKAPDIFIKKLQVICYYDQSYRHQTAVIDDAVIQGFEEWGKLHITEIPASSRLEAIARSAVYNVSMVFQKYVHLLELLVADPLMKERIQLQSMIPETYGNSTLVQPQFSLWDHPLLAPLQHQNIPTLPPIQPKQLGHPGTGSGSLPPLPVPPFSHPALQPHTSSSSLSLLLPPERYPF